MKTAIYIEDGVVQLVLTPESDFEKSSLRSFEERPLEVKVFAGSFFDCRGGWVRQADYPKHTPFDYGGQLQNVQVDRSLILRMAEAKDGTKSTPKPDLGSPVDAPRTTMSRDQVLLGDFFAHERSGYRFVCRAITQRDGGDGLAVAAFEIGVPER